MFLFLESINVNVNQFFLILGFFAIITLILEIPSGYMSDRWGRKSTLLTGSIAASTGILLWATSNGFMQYMVGEFFWAIGFVCFSGTVEATMYDTLLEQGKENSYRIIASRTQSINATVQAIVSIIGGFIAAAISLRAAYWITVPFVLATIPLVFTLIEPTRHKLQETGHIDLITRVTMDTLFRQATLSKIVLLSATTISMIGILLWSTQPYQVLIQLPTKYFGITHAIALFMAAIFAQIIPKLEKRFDDRLIFLIIVILIIGTYLTLGFTVSMFGLAILLMGRSLIGAVLPLSNTLINRMTSSDIRATVLSVRSFSSTLIIAIASPIIGYWAGMFTLNQALLYTGFIGSGVLILLFLGMLKVWKQIPS
ncbi:MFS transporter [Patescibacteria group bacterium]|nr:MFS transporter [Patescibacteria group bacterium]